MNPLYLEDLVGMNSDKIKAHIIEQYKPENPKDLKNFKILVAYESVGSWGCDSSSFFLLQDKKTKRYYENHAQHCSCYGFEGQWNPEKTTKEYLQSDKFRVFMGGYDSSPQSNEGAIKAFVKAL